MNVLDSPAAPPNAAGIEGGGGGAAAPTAGSPAPLGQQKGTKRPPPRHQHQSHAPTADPGAWPGRRWARQGRCNDRWHHGGPADDAPMPAQIAPPPPWARAGPAATPHTPPRAPPPSPAPHTLWSVPVPSQQLHLPARIDALTPVGPRAVMR
jgi:hypothetical protein